MKGGGGGGGGGRQQSEQTTSEGHAESRGGCRKRPRPRSAPSLPPSVVRSEQLLFEEEEEEEALTRMTAAAAAQQRPTHPLNRRLFPSHPSPLAASRLLITEAALEAAAAFWCGKRL